MPFLESFVDKNWVNGETIEEVDLDRLQANGRYLRENLSFGPIMNWDQYEVGRDGTIGSIDRIAYPAAASDQLGAATYLELWIGGINRWTSSNYGLSDEVETKKANLALSAVAKGINDLEIRLLGGSDTKSIKGKVVITQEIEFVSIWIVRSVVLDTGLFHDKMINSATLIFHRVAQGW